MYMTCAEDCDAKHEFENDCCELLISPFYNDQMVRGDDVDVEEFVRSAFPDETPFEKHVLVTSFALILSLSLSLSLSYLYCSHLCCHSNLIQSRNSCWVCDAHGCTAVVL